MKAHELQMNQWYRAERVSFDQKETDVVHTFDDRGSIGVTHCRFGGTNILSWEYYGPLVLDTVAEAEARLDRIQNLLAEQTPCSPS